MQFALISVDGAMFLLRWIHLIAGISWLGLTYYLNFVQTAFLAEIDPATQSKVIQKLLPRALWWLRYGALYTVLSGFGILAVRGQIGGWNIFASSWGVAILTGIAIGLCMAANVWFIIWPKQKIVIRSSVQTAQGGAPLPSASIASAKATLASRINVLFSFPLLFFMAAASHLPIGLGPNANFIALICVLGGIILLVELYAVFSAKVGPFKSAMAVIHSGVVLTAVLYILMEVLTK